MPVRIGLPLDIVGGLKDEVSTPQYANGVGLLKYGIRMSQFRSQGRFGRSKESFLDKIKRGFTQYF
jgi:cell division ATPase FtsA